jgi:superfamily II DNA/RNA helicase
MRVDFFILRSEEKLPALLFLLEHIVKKGKIIVFASTRYHVDYLLAVMGEMYECYGIYGKMDLDQRNEAL